MARQLSLPFGSEETNHSHWLPFSDYAARGYRGGLPKTIDQVLNFVIGSGGKGVAGFDSLNPGRLVALAVLLHYGVDPELVLEAQNRINASQWLHEELGTTKKATDVTREDIERVLQYLADSDGIRESRDAAD